MSHHGFMTLIKLVSVNLMYFSTERKKRASNICHLRDANKIIFSGFGWRWMILSQTNEQSLSQKTRLRVEACFIIFGLYQLHYDVEWIRFYCKQTQIKVNWVISFLEQVFHYKDCGGSHGLGDQRLGRGKEKQIKIRFSMATLHVCFFQVYYLEKIAHIEQINFFNCPKLDQEFEYTVHI